MNKMNCVVRGCTVRSGQGISMHTFTLANKNTWKRIIRLTREICSTARICGLHFSPECFHYGSTRLKVGSNPSHNLGLGERPTERSSTSKSIGGIIEVAPEKDTTGFETIHLTLDGAPPKHSYEKKSCSEKKAKIDEKTMGESAKINELIAARNPGFEPVKVAFESPPKRTYAHGVSGKPKIPQLTCYCRCHKGEEEERRELMLSVEAMKKKEEEQSREIQQLMSQNKISEHLLKTKMKRITELINIEDSLRKEIEALNSRIMEMLEMVEHEAVD